MYDTLVQKTVTDSSGNHQASVDNEGVVLLRIYSLIRGLDCHQIKLSIQAWLSICLNGC